MLGSEAAELGRGGIKTVAEATGAHPDTVARGVRELAGDPEPAVRVRGPGGGRKKLSESDPGLLARLKALVDPETRGDPMSLLVWTTKSTRNLAGALTAVGHPVSDRTVARMLASLGFSLQGNAKVTEGSQHADRDAQFRYLAAQVTEHAGAGQPVVSVDAKKKELVGAVQERRPGVRPAQGPEQVNVHDFPDKELGKAIPYGIYDVSANTGWVSVGTDHDTSAFAVATLRTWWDTVGRARYPAAATATDLRRRRRVQRIPGPGLEDRARRLRRRHRPDGDRRPPTARHQQMEQDRAPAVLPDHPELARTTTDQPPSHRRPDRQHQNSNRPERARRPGHRPIPDRHQLQRQRHRRPTPGPTRLPRRLELHPAASRHAIATGRYFFANP